MNLPSRTACSTILSLVVIFTGLISLFAQQRPDIDRILRQLPPSARTQVAGDNKPKGELIFTAISSGSAFGLKSIGVPLASAPPADAAMRGGSVFVVEAGYCGDKLVGKYMSVLFLDQESRANIFTTNQIAQTASLKLQGTMRRWEHDCNTRRPAYRELDSGPGGMSVDFITSAHIRPRFFQVTATSPASVQGRIWGPGWEEKLRANARVPGQPVAFSYAQSENQASYNPAVLAALRRAGYPVPERIPDFTEGLNRVKAAGFEVADINKPYFHGSLAGTEIISLPRVEVPELSIFFHVSSTNVEADMLVYKPKGLTAGNAPAPGVRNNHSSGGSVRSANSGLAAQRRNPGGRGQTVSPGTYVLIPDSQQNSVGAQAFVNLDNDDKNGFFDNDQLDVAGEDDLVRVVLRVIPRDLRVNRGKARFEVTDAPGNVGVWENETKSTAFNFRDMGVRDFTLGRGEFLGYLIKELWIEGREAHSGQTRTKFKFSYWEDPTTVEPDKVETFAMTVIGIESIEWKGESNSVTYGNVLDADPNYKDVRDAAALRPSECGGSVSSTLKPGAVRVFPGSQVLGGVVDQRPYDLVRAEVKLTTKPVEPLTIYFDGFDVDDPGADGYPSSGQGVDSENWLDVEFRHPEDNRGSVQGGAGASKSGRFVREGADGILAQVFTEQTHLLTFQVTMQPGDNFRIVGSGDKDFLKNLENDDGKLDVSAVYVSDNTNKQRIVDASVLRANPRAPDKAEVRQPEKYASKVLTVWRFLFAEIDSMEAIGEDKIRVSVTGVERNQPANGQTKVKLGGNLTNLFGLITNVVTYQGNSGIKDSLRGGKLKYLTQEYKILSNSAETGYTPDYVIVEGLVPDDAVGKVHSLQDDDEEKWGFKEGMALTDALGDRKPLINSHNTFCSIAERYQPAYVLPDFNSLNHDALNRDKFTPFLRNLKLYEGTDGELLRNYRFNNLRFHDSELLWTVYLLQAYRGSTYEDGDPDGENPISGLADKSNVGVHIFLEGLAERTGGFRDYTPLGLGEKDCIAHEIGHLFGAQHEDGGLMGGPPVDRLFTKRTLARIREAKHP